jgi:hypothetical protein
MNGRATSTNPGNPTDFPNGYSPPNKAGHLRPFRLDFAINQEVVMSEKLKSEMIAPRHFFPSWRGCCVEPCSANDGYDRNGCRGSRW